MTLNIFRLLIVVTLCTGLFLTEWMAIVWLSLSIVTSVFMLIYIIGMKDDEELDSKELSRAMIHFPDDTPFSIIETMFRGIVLGVMLLSGNLVLPLAYMTTSVIYYKLHLKVRTIIKNNGGR